MSQRYDNYHLENFDKLPDISLVRISVVCKLIACSEPTIRRAVKKGEFPKPINPTSRTTCFLVSDIREFLKERCS